MLTFEKHELRANYDIYGGKHQINIELIMQM